MNKILKIYFLGLLWNPELPNSNIIRRFLKTEDRIVDNIEEFEIDSLPKEVLDIRGIGNLYREIDFDYKEQTISLYAWIDGKAGRENKHELPPPVDNELYFGNIYVFKHIDGKLLDFTKDEYDEFYENSYGGFEDLGSEDSYSEEDSDTSDDDIDEHITNEIETEVEAVTNNILRVRVNVNDILIITTNRNNIITTS